METANNEKEKPETETISDTAHRMNPFLNIHKSDTVHVFELNRHGVFPFGIPTNADLEDFCDTVPIVRLDPAYVPGSFYNDPDYNPDMKFNIETGIEIPKRERTGLARELIEVMSVIEVGQSFFVSNELHQLHTIRGAFDYAKKQIPGKMFASRKAFLPPPGIRIWRTE